jgi:hypothetical protein
MAHGKSFSESFPLGARSMSNGKAKAPTSLRKAGKKWLSECSVDDLGKAGLDISQYDRDKKEDREALALANML